MNVKATAVIKKESQIDPRNPQSTNYYASLSLFSDKGREYGVTRYDGGFQQIGNLLEREAGVPHELLQNKIRQYDDGDEVRIALALSNEAIRNLGFDPKAA